MAADTDKSLRNQVMYCVFVRQYSPEGTFDKVREDLGRIRALGVDIIWLMPIHPIGLKRRKGSLGSPYAISDYRAVNPEYGTLEDFKALVDAIHSEGMKCIIDVVYNHTSPDSVLSREHPEWFYHRPDGTFGNRIGEWYDVIDLDYEQRGLWDYQIDTLKKWAGIVDGFRCDVAPLIPLEFWREARRQVAQVRPDCLWLSESVEPEFTVENRSRGMMSLSDSEIFQAFDISYEYDVYHDWVRYMTGEMPLKDYLFRVRQQEYLYPDNYVKLRFLENHDRMRAAFMAPDERALRNWTAFVFFQRGLTLIYNGQEKACVHRPGLFDRDAIPWWTGRDLSGRISSPSRTKRSPLLRDGAYTVREGGRGIIIGEYVHDDECLVGVFCVEGRGGVATLSVPDGIYTDLIGGGDVQAEQGLVSVGGEPVIFTVTNGQRSHDGQNGTDPA